MVPNFYNFFSKCSLLFSEFCSTFLNPSVDVPYVPSYETFFKPALCIVKHKQHYFVELVPVSNQICVKRMHKLTHGRRKVIFDKQFRFLPVSLSSYSLRKGYVNSPLNW